VERDSDEAVYEKYADELIRFATGLVGPSDAADVLSMAVLRSFGSPGWANVRDHRAYLTRAVLNEARMNYRSTMRRRAREQRFLPRDIIEPPEVRPEVLASVSRLSARQRAVVVLTYWDDLDPDEIALRLDISAGSVRKHLARAHARLRKAINDD
jgi:RNA polymerase sigma-70 factor (ECF subfamily)